MLVLEAESLSNTGRSFARLIIVRAALAGGAVLGWAELRRKYGPKDDEKSEEKTLPPNWQPDAAAENRAENG